MFAGNRAQRTRYRSFSSSMALKTLRRAYRERLRMQAKLHRLAGPIGTAVSRLKHRASISYANYAFGRALGEEASQSPDFRRLLQDNRYVVVDGTGRIWLTNRLGLFQRGTLVLKSQKILSGRYSGGTELAERLSVRGKNERL